MNALIIEDEVLASKHLKQVLNETGNITVIGTIDSISDTIEWFSINPQPDIVFMDIHLADGLAFEIFNHIDITCPVVFTTAYDDYALRAFKVNSIDYLLKPIEVADVQSALNKLKVLSGPAGVPDSLSKLVDFFRKEQKYKTHFLVPQKGDKLIPLRVADIACFYIDAGIVKILTFNSQSYNFDSTLDELYEMLDPINFFRANRQFIINREAVKDADLWFNSKLSLNLKTQLPSGIVISKARVQEFKAWFMGSSR